MAAPFEQYRRTRARRSVRWLVALVAAAVSLTGIGGAFAGAITRMPPSIIPSEPASPAASGVAMVQEKLALDLTDLMVERAFERPNRAMAGGPGEASIALSTPIPLRIRSGACVGDAVRLHLAIGDQKEPPAVHGTISWISPVPRMVGRKVVHDATIDVDRAELQSVAPGLFRASRPSPAPAPSLATRLLDRLRSFFAAFGG